MGRGNGGRGLRGGLQQTGGDIIRPAAVGRWARQRRQNQLHISMGTAPHTVNDRWLSVAGCLPPALEAEHLPGWQPLPKSPIFL